MAIECQDAIYSNDYADVIIDFLAEDAEELREFSAICSTRFADYIEVLYVPRDRINQQTDYYGYEAIPKLYGLMDTSNMESAGILRLRRQPYLDLLGQNTIIGIVDTGIDYLNPLFQNADQTSRIGTIWDQTIQDGTPPEGFLYGGEYLKERINQAIASDNPLDIVPSTDENGHGTFLAGISAGNDDVSNNFTGVAPLAELAIVKLKPAKPYLREYFGVDGDAVAFQENDILAAIAYLLKYANRQNKPISICIGLGTNSSDHDGNSILAGYLDFVSGLSGVCISAAAGNESNKGNHHSGAVDIGSSTDVELKVGDDDKDFSMELWAEYPRDFSLAVISPSGEISGRVLGNLTSSLTIRFIFEPTIIQVNNYAIEYSSGNQLIFMRFTDAVPGIWKLRVYNDSTYGKEFNMWLPISQFISRETYFLDPDPYVTLVETATANKPITVAGYNHRNNSLFINSSRGYTLSGRIKPDITAPAVNIFGPTGRGTFGERSGTSIAAAHVAGAAVLILQWGYYISDRKNLDSTDIKTILTRGAERTDQVYPNREWGYGTLNVYNSFESLRTLP